MSATAGSAKKEIAKTEKQDATILPERFNIIFILESAKIHQWDIHQETNVYMNLILPAQVRGTVSPYPIVVTVIWKIFLECWRKIFLECWRKIFSHFMTVWVLCSHPMLNYRHCHWQEAEAEKYCTFSKRLTLFRRVGVCGGKLISGGGPGNESNGILQPAPPQIQYHLHWLLMDTHHPPP